MRLEGEKLTKKNDKLWNSKIRKTIRKRQSDSKGFFYTTAAGRRYTYTMVLKKNGFLSPLVPWVIFSGAGGNNLLINRSLKLLSTFWVKIISEEKFCFSSILELVSHYIAWTATNFSFTGVSERCSKLEIGQCLQGITHQV